MDCSISYLHREVELWDFMVKSDVPPTPGRHIGDLWNHFQILGIFEK